MKIIRWWGLAVFLGLIILLTLTWYLLAPHIIKNTVEELGSETLGAQVEIKSVDLSLFPLSVTINNFAAADPQQPMQNIFESKQIKFAVDSSALLWKKIIIDEMVISEVTTGTKRQKSGALKGGRKITQAINNITDINIPDFNQADIENLVAKADLITLKRLETLKASQNKLKNEWKNDLDKAEFDKRLNILKLEYKRLLVRAKENKLNLINDRKDWKNLKKSISAERKLIANLSDKLKQDKNNLSAQLKSVKEGPNDDLQAVMKKIGVSDGIDGLVDKYLGSQYKPWVKKAISMLKDFKQKKGQKNPEQSAENTASIQVGDRVYFNDTHHYPELLIKKILISGSNQGWELYGNGSDLGYLPWLTGKPAKLNLDFGGKGKAKVSLLSDWKSEKEMKTNLNSNITSWPIESMLLMQTEAGSWLINSGNLNAVINGDLTLEKINFVANFSIKSPQIETPDGISSWQKSLATSINKEAQIDLTVTANGSLDSSQIKLKSSLEKLFKKAIGDKAKSEAEKLTGKIKQSITNKIGDISDIEKFNSNFDQWQNQITDKDKLLNDLLGKIKL